MDIDGIWRVEFLGVQGWETVSTSYLENGRYLAGGAHGYAVGHYTSGPDGVVIHATISLYGRGITIFGRGSGDFGITYEGELSNGQLSGRATDGQYHIHFRSTRVGDLPRVSDLPEEAST